MSVGAGGTRRGQLGSALTAGTRGGRRGVVAWALPRPMSDVCMLRDQLPPSALPADCGTRASDRGRARGQRACGSVGSVSPPSWFYVCTATCVCVSVSSSHPVSGACSVLRGAAGLGGVRQVDGKRPAGVCGLASTRTRLLCVFDHLRGGQPDLGETSRALSVNQVPSGVKLLEASVAEIARPSLGCGRGRLWPTVGSPTAYQGLAWGAPGPGRRSRLLSAGLLSAV